MFLFTCQIKMTTHSPGGKIMPGGSLGTMTAGWFWTRANNTSDGSLKTTSSYDSTTTGFLTDMEPDSSSGYNFKWWYLWNVNDFNLSKL